MELYELTVHELMEKLEKGETTSEEIVKSYFDRIKEKDGQVGAYLSTLEEQAIEKAKEIDTRRANGEKLGKFAEFQSESKIICVLQERKQHVLLRC